MNKREIAKWLRESARNCYRNDEAECYNLNLEGGELVLSVGWLGGYEDKVDDCGLFKSRTQPTYCVNAGIFIRNDADCADMEFLAIPWNDNGDCWDNRCSIGKDTDFNDLADFFIREFNEMTEAIEMGELFV